MWSTVLKMQPSNHFLVMTKFDHAKPRRNLQKEDHTLRRDKSSSITRSKILERSRKSIERSIHQQMQWCPIKKELATVLLISIFLKIFLTPRSTKEGNVSTELHTPLETATETHILIRTRQCSFTKHISYKISKYSKLKKPRR